jgi:3-dehydroquinate synthase
MKNISKDNCSIFGDDNAWKSLNAILHKLAPSKLFVLTDSNVKKHCLSYFTEKLEFARNPQILIIPAGEKNKTIHSCLALWQELSAGGADRKSLLINLGGGVVSDLGGFVASTFKRGIPFINIPTTLLAMVDASVGGKNGVDLGTLKNQIGIIRNPLCVIIDTKFLKTLPKTELNSGYAEMLKHGLIHSEAYWKQVTRFDITNISEANELIWGSIVIKNKVVSEDPFENGVRKTLNYGHTLGHAIESYLLEHSTKPALLHGEAIAIGMILTTFISSELLSFPKSKLDEITKTILLHFPKTVFNDNDLQAIIKLLIYDKKNERGKVLFVLLYDIGKHKINCEVSNTLIIKSFEYYKNF